MSIDQVREKAEEIVKLGDGMAINEFFGALALATAQSLKYMCPDTLPESLEWYVRNVRMIATSPDEPTRRMQ